MQPFELFPLDHIGERTTYRCCADEVVLVPWFAVDGPRSLMIVGEDFELLIGEVGLEVGDPAVGW